MSQKAKRRFCPATQRDISAAECGESRVSRYPCPVECPFNPFAPAQYDQFTAIEAGVIRKSLDWFLKDAPDSAARSRQLDQMANRSDVEQHSWQVAEFFYRRDDQGRTCADRWLAAGLPGLKNDERVIERAVMQLRPRLIEVHRVFDDLRMEAVDLFEPDTPAFMICDRGLAAQVCRFSTILGWFFPLPHFWRSFGFAVQMPPIASFEPLEIVNEIVRHLGGPADPNARNDWLGINLARFSDALEAVGLARREQMFAGLDAEFGKTIYELRAPFAECRGVLDRAAQVAPDDLADGEEDEGFAEARVWFDESSPQPVTVSARPVVGRVLLGQAHWRLEAIGRERLGRLRAQFEQTLGERVRFAGERCDNLVAHLKSKEKKYDPTLVPPRLLENPSKIELTSSRAPVAMASGSAEEMQSTFMGQFDRAWLDESVPALNGRTPRDASRDRALRPRLIRLLKDRVRSTDERNLETGGTTDANWMLKELGADEILFDPPPPRAPTPVHPSSESPDVDEGFDGVDDLDPWPTPPSRPFNREEAVARLEVGLTTFDTFADAENTMEEAGGFIAEDVHQIVGNLLNEDEYAFLAPYLIQVWFAFVPPGCFGPDIEVGEIHEAFGRQVQALEQVVNAGPEATSQFLLESGPQLPMVQALSSALISHRKDFPRAAKFQKDSLPLMLIILRTVIEVLDAKCRENTT